MLTHLEIRDLVIVDHVELAFGPGLGALTGETGAGKSILLDALGLVLGWRSRAGLVRQGAEQGEVTAVFELGPGHPARAVLSEAGFPLEEDELILRRVVRADGRKSGWINGRRASGEALRAVGAQLVELHGQGDESTLLDPRAHRRLLDSFAGNEALLAATAQAWADLRARQEALEAARATLEASRAEEDFLRHGVAELEALAPQPGEEAELDAARRRMQAAERIGEDITRAAQALGPGAGAEGRMGDALRWLEGAEAQAGELISPAIAALGRALVELGEASDAVSRATEALHFDPRALEEAEERLFAIRALARKHAVTPEELPALGEELARRLAALDAGEEALAQRAAEVAEARAAYEAAAGQLSEARRAAARRLDTAMAGELAPLRMERAVFTTEVSAGTPGPEGTDQVTFVAATNPGAPAGPLSKVASGGELSRFLLALKVCLTAGNEDVTLIFDEIDRGVGGATAAAVGRRLARLGEEAQVLVVTHSPQVAARAARQWHVAKGVEDGLTRTRVHPLDAEARIDEIARMLAGDIVTEEARAAARALLETGETDAD